VYGSVSGAPGDATDVNVGKAGRVPRSLSEDIIYNRLRRYVRGRANRLWHSQTFGYLIILENWK